MGLLEEELHAGIDEAVRKMTEARMVGDDYGAETYRERLEFLRRVAGRHGFGPWPCPEPTAGGEAGGDCCQAAAPVPCSA